MKRSLLFLMFAIGAFLGMPMGTLLTGCYDPDRCCKQNEAKPAEAPEHVHKPKQAIVETFSLTGLDDVRVLHDDKRQVTCWIHIGYQRGGISCLSDNR